MSHHWGYGSKDGECPGREGLRRGTVRDTCQQVPERVPGTSAPHVAPSPCPEWERARWSLSFPFNLEMLPAPEPCARLRVPGASPASLLSFLSFGSGTRKRGNGVDSGRTPQYTIPASEVQGLPGPQVGSALPPPLPVLPGPAARTDSSG